MFPFPIVSPVVSAAVNNSPAFDAFLSSASSSGTINFNFTPVGTPKGILVFFTSTVDGTDNITSGLTYGGVAMTELSVSPNLKATGEAGSVHAFFLGTGIPTGVQAIQGTKNATLSRWFVYSLTATADLSVQDAQIISSDAVANPSVNLSLGGNTCFCALALASGQDATSGIAPLGGWNGRNETDNGTMTVGSYSYNTIAAVDVTAGWTQTSEDAIAIAVAIK